ncbi:hypothetical protein F3Y22_tig00111877pilonHSYRG00250 [Hibiscus syriacus]|uniref:Uncharacterized protein n=1 Tax=Hibiscus syriacus TaxID=106335 RepID=A0A6A2XQ02_HIBSY|nr:hypothetical protein F3Y22_tig00111877pilonHSYRG00250 [Hibiscus syriacus]
MATQGDERTAPEGVEVRNPERKRGMSKDLLASLQGKITRLEDSARETKEVLDRLESIDLEKLGSQQEDAVEGQILALRQEVEELKDRGSGTEVEDLKKEIEKLKTEVALCKAAMAGNMMTSTPKGRAKVPKPEKFKGTRSAKDVENFMWDMDQYFQAMGIENDTEKENIAAVYLTDLALLWWRRKCAEMKRDGTTIRTWAEFQFEFKEQFYPHHAENEARSKLRRLRHDSSLKEHVRQFVELSLQVPSLSEEDGFFTFMDGLKPCTKNELECRGVKDLAKALSTAESLIELGVRKHDSSKSKYKAKGGDKEKPFKGKSDKEPSGPGKPSNNRTQQGEKQEKQPIQCYNYKGLGHLARECPQKNQLSAIDGSVEEEEEAETLKLGSIISTMEVKKVRKKKGLMFVDISIKGQKLSALVDTGASELFMSNQVASKLALHIEKASGYIKTVNAEEVPIKGISKGVELNIGSWTGKEVIKVIPLDDFDVVLGLSFLDKINAFPVPFADCLCILDSKHQCIVPINRGPGVGAKMLSAIQFSRVMHKKEPIFLASLVSETQIATEDVPRKVRQLLSEFEYIMPPKLPKALPPKREVDHKIELKKPAGLLQPLPIPERPWESISMDFIIGLPHSEGLSSIMVVVDRFSKYGTFIPASKVCPTKEAARLFLKHVVFPKRSSAIEIPDSRADSGPKIYLRHYVSATQSDWPKLLDVAQFSYNLQKSEATNRSPFEIVNGQQPLTPNMVIVGYQGPNPSAYQFAKEWQESYELARACLHKVGKRTKKWADKNRRDVNFQEGDLVLAKLTNILRNQDRHKGLVRRYEGPFKILKRIGTMAYRLDLPKTIRAHPVLHVSLLKPFHPDEDDPD